MVGGRWTQGGARSSLALGYCLLPRWGTSLVEKDVKRVQKARPPVVFLFFDGTEHDDEFACERRRKAKKAIRGRCRPQGVYDDIICYFLTTYALIQTSLPRRCRELWIPNRGPRPTATI